MTAELYHYLRAFSKFMSKYHAIIFFSFVSMLIALGVLFLYLILESTFSPAPLAGDNIGSFDQTTINRIKNLNDSSNGQNATVTLPSPRPNPFVE